MGRKRIVKGVWQLQEEGLCANAYLLESKGKKLLIDSGSGSLKLEVAPDICILTHGHADHTGGVKEDWKRVYLHEREFGFAGAYIKVPVNARRIDFENLAFGGFSLKILHTPGHTAGSVCIFEKGSGVLFSGDTKFADGGRGRTDLGGNEKEMEKSLKLIEKIPYRLLCPGHGECEKMG